MTVCESGEGTLRPAECEMGSRRGVGDVWGDGDAAGESCGERRELMSMMTAVRPSSYKFRARSAHESRKCAQ